MDKWAIAQELEPPIKEEAQGLCVLRTPGVSSTLLWSPRAPSVGGSAPHPFQEPLLKLQGTCELPEHRALSPCVLCCTPGAIPHNLGSCGDRCLGICFSSPANIGGHGAMECSDSLPYPEFL